MKKQLSILLAAVLLLSGCTAGRSLSDRAIVKTIYLDQTEQGYEAALVVFTCQPISDTKSVEEQAEIYAGSGESIEEALAAAEQQQNKQAFYAQDEILLLGPGVWSRDISPLLTYFQQEKAARAGLSVFLTPVDSTTFGECTDTISGVVQEGERIIDDSLAGDGPARGIYTLKREADKVEGWLPVLDFGPDKETQTGVFRLALVEQGRAVSLIEGPMMDLAMLLSGNASRLQFQSPVLTFVTQHLRSRKTMENGKLVVRLEGNVQEITLRGENVKTDEALALVNETLGLILTQLGRVTLGQDNDAFHLRWWMRQERADAPEVPVRYESDLQMLRQ